MRRYFELNEEEESEIAARIELDPSSTFADSCPSAEQKLALVRFANAFNWYEPPETAARVPEKVLAKAMCLGSLDDWNQLERIFGEELLRQSVRASEAGYFDDRSWHYWHYRLRMARTEDQVPPLPARRTA